jgi:hypothetical protein
MNELILAGIALKERTKDGEIENFYEFTWYVDRKIHKVVLNDLPKNSNGSSIALNGAWVTLQQYISNYLQFEKCSFDLQSFKITQKAKKVKDAEGEVYEELNWFFNYSGLLTKDNLETQKVSFAKPILIKMNEIFANKELEFLMACIIEFDAVASEFVTQKLDIKIN